MKYNSVKGVEDILPPDIAIWQRLESVAREVFGSFGFGEARPPIMEYTDVFTRSIGETSDIVEKEMYTFMDKGNRSITLRPEGTAPMVRAFVEHNLNANLPTPQKFFYMGPMFRYERPQKGRLRQFYQIGAEAYGAKSPLMDAEIITMLTIFLAKAGLGCLTVELNSIGCPTCRPAYRDALKAHFSARAAELCDDCNRRLDANPLRILDCKSERCIRQKEGAPAVTSFLCESCSSHFERLRDHLDHAGVVYVLNPMLVRGLDYYTGTTFEVKSMNLGAQNAVAAGGRYDLLVREFGGPDTPATGFAVGMERLVSLLRDAAPAPSGPLAFIAVLGEAQTNAALRLALALRADGHWVELGDGGSLKSQMRRADRFGAHFALILGEDELRDGKIAWKNLAGEGAGSVRIDEIGGVLKG